MRRMILFICLVLVETQIGWSQNLIPDPGFENSVKISDSSNWHSPNDATPDLIGDEQKSYGSAYACKGRHSAGLILYDGDNPTFREYIGCRLNQVLLKDTCYELSFWVQASASSYYLTDGFGIWLGQEEIRYSGYGLADLKPIWKQPRAEVISESGIWKLVKIPIKANGGEQFLLFGNFNNDEQTLLQVNNRHSAFRLAYLQMDEMSLVPCHSKVALQQQDNLQTLSRKGNLFIPNVVTPNNDGFNDEFYIPGLSPYTGIIITDAKDREVFREKAYRNNWTGTDCLSGKYHYELLLPDGNLIYGSFDLVRKSFQSPPLKPKKKRRR